LTIPKSQASKLACVRRLLGHEPDHLTFVEIDFTHDNLGVTLAAGGQERSAKTLFIWSGVSPYLPEAAVGKVLSWVGAHRSPCTSIVFDACWAGAIDGSGEYFGAAEWRERAAKMGEPLRWGIQEGRVEETVSRFGLKAVRILTSEEGRATYLRRSDGTLHDPPVGCWVLVHASAG